jgi:hypothetical protein
MKKAIGLGASLFIISFVTGYFFGASKTKSDVWTGFYYPDVEKIEDRRTWVLSPPLHSLDECREWVSVIQRKADSNYDYSCGKGCYFTQQYEGETVICQSDSK